VSYSPHKKVSKRTLACLIEINPWFKKRWALFRSRLLMQSQDISCFSASTQMLREVSKAGRASQRVWIKLLNDSDLDLSCHLIKHRYVIWITAKYKAIFQGYVKDC
jgi:hypothetical protein